MIDEMRENESILDGFFYFFGFSSNPLKSQVDQIIDVNSHKKIKNDLKKLNSDYRKSYTKMRKEMICLE